MADFTIPELGENIVTGDVTRVLVKVGDTISVEQPVLELETDKATIEVPSSVAGVVKAIKVKAGDKVKVGAVVLTVEGEGTAASGSGEAESPAAASRPAAAPPADEDPPAPAPAATAPRTAEPAEPAETAETPAGAGAASPVSRVVQMPVRQSVDAGGQERRRAAPASPAVRRLAREIGVDVNDVSGTGRGGRISQADVKEHARRILSSVGAAGGGAPAARAARALPDFTRWGEVDRQPWTNIRRATSEHLSFAWTTIPHVTQFDKADVTELEALRRRYREQVAEAGGNLTVTAMLVRILATAVRKFPQFNASLDLERGEIVYKQYVSVGVAVDTDRGLLVPVVRDADTKNLTELAVEIQQAAQRARDRKLSVEEMSGGGITISNLGGIGGTYFTPIVNCPEVAILGVSRGRTEPVWRPSTGSGQDPAAGSGQAASTGSGQADGRWEPRPMLPLSLSYDHRVIDGADAMRFLRWVVEAIEQPFLLSLVG
jgi:pyruvate dehydrogenase E2 component (dihydrolipoamide acetyltransferase)